MTTAGIIVAYPWATVQRHQKGKHNQKDHGRRGATANIHPSISPEAARKIVDYENQIAGDTLENMVIFNLDGSPLVEKQGVADRVTLSLAESEYDLKDRILSHNHPKRAALSPADASTFAKGALELRAVDDKYTYSLRRSESLKAPYYQGKLDRKFGEEINAKATQAWRNAWAEGVISGDIDPLADPVEAFGDTFPEYHHQAWQEWAAGQEYFVYERTERKP